VPAANVFKVPAATLRRTRASSSGSAQRRRARVTGHRRIVIKPGSRIAAPPSAEVGFKIKTGPFKEIFAGSILRHRRVDLLCPGSNAALKVAQFLEARFLQDMQGAGAAGAALALQNDVVRTVEFTESRR
jgi:hypothetical protein